MSIAPQIAAAPSLEQTLEAARRRIEVSRAELDEARRRRDQIGAALRDACPGSRVYVNGSIAHGDALYPLTDVDLGVLVPDPNRRYGPAKRPERVEGPSRQSYPHGSGQRVSEAARHR
jgi:hypothetical protein